MKGLALVPAVALILSFAATAPSATTYGKAVTVTETTEVSQILDNPAQYLGKEVKVRVTNLQEGVILGVELRLRYSCVCRK